MGFVQFLVISAVVVWQFVVDANQVISRCPPSAPTCEFWLALHPSVTFQLIVDAEYIPVKYPLVTLEDGHTYIRDHYCSNGILGRFPDKNGLFPDKDFADVPVGDGRYKDVFLFNNSLPGPPIVVYQGQQVVVHVTNRLVNEVTTVHFHGLQQRNTPWMDGAGGLSQCPINKGETFTYRFMAEQTGTYWYHTHLGTQRTMGAYGPLVVLPDVPTRFAGDFYMMVSDWFLESSAAMYEKVKFESVSYPYGWDVPLDVCYNSTKQADGQDAGVFPFQSALVNGRGWFYKRVNSTDEPMNAHVPLETFTVSRGLRFRFRLISAAMTFPLRVSIDGHMMHVIATDGNEVEEREVESIVVSGGERYDFWIEASDPDNTGLYWIRVDTLEEYQDSQKLQSRGRAEAVLQYDYAPDPARSDVYPESKRNLCTVDAPCQVLNCPFQRYAPGSNLVCIPLVTLHSLQPSPTLQPGDDPSQPFLEKFLNFHFVKFDKGWKPTINNIQHVPPVAPPQVYPDARHQDIKNCSSNTSCVGALCQCTHVVEIPLGALVQFTFMVTVDNPDGITNGNSHNVHLHGFTFEVVKVGFPSYHAASGWVKNHTEDIVCDGHYCQEPRWKDPSWRHGSIPGAILERPPRKDTILIPVGGYAVVRFLADNPGYWFMHCHTEFHSEDGMALYLKVGSEKDMVNAPGGMNRCGHFDWTAEQLYSAVSDPGSFNMQVDNVIYSQLPDWCQLTLALLSFMCVLMLAVIVVLMIKLNYLRTVSGFSKLF